MTLPDSYLSYPHRSTGMDHDIYPRSNMFERTNIEWPGGKSLALWITVALEYFPLVPNDGPFRAPGHMVTPYPDYRSYTTRDYGNRVGIYRILDVLDAFGFKASIPMNAAIATRYPSLLKEITSRGHEIIVHGMDMNAIHYGGMEAEVEQKQIEDAISLLRGASGQTVTGWLSPARSESENTLSMLADAGIDYVCDWVNDDLPYHMHTENGPLVAMPHTMELEDRHLLVNLGQSENTYMEQVLEAAKQYRLEATRYGGRILHLSLTPYVIGQPWRIGTLEKMLARILDGGEIWSASGAEIHSTWANQNELI